MDTWEATTFLFFASWLFALVGWGLTIYHWHQAIRFAEYCLALLPQDESAS